MTVGGIPTNSAIGLTQGVKSTAVATQAAIAVVVSTGTPAPGDVSSVSTASQLQAQTNGLKNLAANLAQGAATTQVADQGAAQIESTLTQLQSLADQASAPGISDAARVPLNQTFQQLIATVTTTVNTTTFGGKKLLDGSAAGSSSLSLNSLLTGGDGGEESVSVPNLNGNSLFGVPGPDVLSADNVAKAKALLGTALAQVTTLRSNLSTFQQHVSFATANVESALANQQAVQSTFTEADANGASVAATLQNNAAAAEGAQGNRLSAVIQKLLG